MSRIYNKYIDQSIRSVNPTFGQEKTEAYKRNLESKKLFKKAEARKIEKQTENKAKGGRVGRKGGGGLGAQSVKYGLDDNYDVTAADPKAKFIAAAKNKKKKNKKFESPMAKSVKKKDKKRISAKHGSYKKASDGPQPVVYVTKAEDKKSEEILKKNKKRGFGSGLSRPKSQQV